MIRMGCSLQDFSIMYLFIALTFYLSLKLIKQPSIRNLIVTSLAIGLGILSKEGVLVVLSFLTLYLLVVKRDLKLAVTVTIASLLLPALWYLYVGYTPLTIFFERVGSRGYQVSWGFKQLLKSIYGAFLLGLPLALLGILEETNRDGFLMLATYAVVCISTLLIWPVMVADVSFILFPAIVTYVPLGLSYVSLRLKSLMGLNEKFWITLVLLTQLLYSNFSALAWLRLPF